MNDLKQQLPVLFEEYKTWLVLNQIPHYGETVNSTAYGGLTVKPSFEGFINWCSNENPIPA
jgi:hypothetical protein